MLQCDGLLYEAAKKARFVSRFRYFLDISFPQIRILVQYVSYLYSRFVHALVYIGKRNVQQML